MLMRKISLYVASHLEGFSSRPASPTAQMETSNRVSPRLNQPPIPGDAGEPSPILLGTNIPSIRDLYRSGVLISRDDRRYAPNDRFNEIISFCRYDITRLEVSAIGKFFVSIPRLYLVTPLIIRLVKVTNEAD